MRLCAIFLTLNIQLSHIFAFPQNPPELSVQTNHDLEGYECGNVFITVSEVNKALSLARDSLDKGNNFPQIYQGELYSDPRFEEYFLYPIVKGSFFRPNTKVAKSVFRVVFTRNSNEAVDVVAKITNGDYTKCIRRYKTHLEPSYSMQEFTNGYLCGSDFVTDETIHRSLALAQNKVEEKTEYHSPYIGILYPENSGHLIWPITREGGLYESGKSHVPSCYLVLDNERQFIDVVVRGYNNNFLRCIRSRKLPKAPASDSHSKLSVPPSKAGYLCGKNFFDENMLEVHAEKIKRQGGMAHKGQELDQYSGPPYDQPCLIWPIMNDGSLYKRGHRGNMRLILTTDYKVMGVAISIEGKLKPCERKTIMAKKGHDTSDYHCNKDRLSHQQLVVAAERACVKMTVRRNVYPARYKGPGFNLEGPYFTYPIHRNGNVGLRGIGQHRVVITANCEVVGALTMLEDFSSGDFINGFSKRLVKCHRIDDGPLPPMFFGINAETVYEFNSRNKLKNPVDINQLSY